MIREDKRQQEILRQFYKEESTWFPEHFMYTVLACIFIGISTIIVIMPYQVWELPQDFPTVALVYCLEWTGVAYYLQKFTVYKEGRQFKSIFRLLKHLPISPVQLHIFVMKKAAKLCLFLTGTAIFFQVVFALAFLHTCSVGNIAVPFLCSFIIPLGIVAFTRLLHR